MRAAKPRRASTSSREPTEFRNRNGFFELYEHGSQYMNSAEISRGRLIVPELATSDVFNLAAKENLQTLNQAIKEHRGANGNAASARAIDDAVADRRRDIVHERAQEGGTRFMRGHRARIADELNPEFKELYHELGFLRKDTNVSKQRAEASARKAAEKVKHISGGLL